MVADFVSIVKSAHDTHSFPTPWLVKQPQIITELPPCLIVGIVYFGSNSSRGVLQTHPSRKDWILTRWTKQHSPKNPLVFQAFLWRTWAIFSIDLIHLRLLVSNSSNFVCPFSNCINVQWNSSFILDLNLYHGRWFSLSLRWINRFVFLMRARPNKWPIRFVDLYLSTIYWTVDRESHVFAAISLSESPFW